MRPEALTPRRFVRERELSVPARSVICMERGPGGGSAGDPLSSPDLVEESISLVRQGLSRLRDARLWVRSDAQARDLVDATLQLAAQVQAAYLAAVRDLDTRPDPTPSPGPAPVRWPRPT
jgi:hypothetical protein